MADDPLEAFNAIVDPIVREEEAHASAAAVLAENRRAYLEQTPDPLDNQDAMRSVRADVAAVFAKDRP